VAGVERPGMSRNWGGLTRAGDRRQRERERERERERR